MATGPQSKTPWSWQPWLVWMVLGAAACELAIGDADLQGVLCQAEGSIGPPSCAGGEVCAKGHCVACAAKDVCGNGIDDDCNGKPDDGCAGSAGSDGGPQDARDERPVVSDGWPESSAGTGATGGTGGGTGGDGGSGGAAGAAATGGTAGVAGAGGTAGVAGAGGSSATGGTGAVAGGGSGGEPTCGALGASCLEPNDCCNNNCCYLSSALHCGKPLFEKCQWDWECCSGHCTGTYCLAY